jgi:hypothetical protein
LIPLLLPLIIFLKFYVNYDLIITFLFKKFNVFKVTLKSQLCKMLTFRLLCKHSFLIEE